MSLNYYASFRLRRILSFLLLMVLLTALGFTVVAKDRHKPPVAPAKTTKRDTRETAAKPAKSNANKRDTAADKRSNKQTAQDKAAAAKDKGKNSKREREKAARLVADRRRQEALEAERRRRAAAAAAEARRRAIDQGLRDETQANILRDETTGEDLEIRRIAIQALGNKAGSVVVMDPRSGRVFTVVNQDWALRKGYKPCSTIKLVTGMAGLSEHVIDNGDTVNIADRNYRLDLTDSLAYSNNGYFQNVGGQVGFERMVKYARQLGLGEPTGINQPNESAGRVPLFKSGYAVNHMSSHGDDFEVTPIQLATLVSAMANGGNLLTPHLPRTPEENYNFRRIVRRRIDVS
ncbi:MAG: penicillin-binding transpeptidase domain-containing protein, partial [Pyrinomonadaceae bacterium]